MYYYPGSGQDRAASSLWLRAPADVIGRHGAVRKEFVRVDPGLRGGGGGPLSGSPTPLQRWAGCDGRVHTPCADGRLRVSG